MKKILVVDNEEYIREVTKICLETTANWHVVTAASGQEGIKSAISEQPDAILLDVMMPDMDGFHVLQQLQQTTTTQAIPVILISAKIQPSDRQQYTEWGVSAVLTKPFNPLELANQIVEALGWSCGRAT